MHLKISFAKWWPFLSRGRRVKSTCTILNYMVLFHTMLDAVFPHHLLGFHNTDKPDSDLSKVQTSVMRSLAWLCVVPCHRIQRCILLQRMYFLAVLMIGAQPLPEPMLIQCLSPPKKKSAKFQSLCPDFLWRNAFENVWNIRAIRLMPKCVNSAPRNKL